MQGTHKLEFKHQSASLYVHHSYYYWQISFMVCFINASILENVTRMQGTHKLEFKFFFFLTAPTSLLSRPMPKATVATTFKYKCKSVIMKVTCTINLPINLYIHTYKFSKTESDRVIFLTTLILFEQNSSCIRLRSFEVIELW